MTSFKPNIMKNLLLLFFSICAFTTTAQDTKLTYFLSGEVGLTNILISEHPLFDREELGSAAKLSGAVVFEKESDPLPDNATFGLTGHEVQWDGVVRCGDGINLPWGDGCPGTFDCVVGLGPSDSPGPEGRCSDLYTTGPCSDPNNPECYQYHSDGVYAWILRVRSCTRESFGDCGWGFPCDSDDGFYCSDGLEEETMLVGDITMWKNFDGN